MPEEAARVHIEACPPLVNEALAAMNCAGEIEAIAVTQGPGLIGCLLVGVETAKGLAWAHDKPPLMAVNHLAGHLHAIFPRASRGARIGFFWADRNLPRLSHRPVRPPSGRNQ